MLQKLQLIREQLFDAPSDVKKSFNSLVNWFDDKRYYIIEREPTTHNLSSLQRIFRDELDNIKNLSPDKDYKLFRRSIVKNEGEKNKLEFNGYKNRGGGIFTSKSSIGDIKHKLIEGPFKTKEEAEKKLNEIGSRVIK